MSDLRLRWSPPRCPHPVYVASRYFQKNPPFSQGFRCLTFGPFGPVLGPSFFSLPPPGGSLPPPGGLDRLRAFSLPFLKTTHPPCVSLSLEPSVLSFFSKHKHHHLSSKLIFRTNMTSPHQFSPESAVLTPISQCEDRSQAYLWVIRLDLPLWPSLFAFFVPIFHVFHSSLSAAVFARLFCLLLFQAL